MSSVPASRWRKTLPVACPSSSTPLVTLSHCARRARTPGGRSAAGWEGRAAVGEGQPPGIAGYISSVLQVSCELRAGFGATVMAPLDPLEALVGLFEFRWLEVDGSQNGAF